MKRNAMSRATCSIALTLALATGGTAAALAAERDPEAPKIACDGLGTCVASFSIDIGTSESLVVQAGTTNGGIIASTSAGVIGTLPVSDAFRPASLRLGIVAIPAGDARRAGARLPVPALAFQDGDDVFLYAFAGQTFRLLVTATVTDTVPHGASAADIIDLLLSRYTFVPLPDDGA
jgi:hypothetical protein